MHAALTYFAFGSAIALAGVEFVAVDYLWKEKFFNKLLIVSIVSSCLGLLLEASGTLQQPTGATFTIMAYPSAFLAYFQILRWLYKRIRSTEPYVTSASGALGGPPLDSYISAGRDGRRRKYEKGRRISAWDFAFTFLLVLPPILAVGWLLAFLYRD